LGARFTKVELRPSDLPLPALDDAPARLGRSAWPDREGLEVCHRCDERRCCNPDHLYLGTHADNMAVMGATRRALRRIPLEGLRYDLPDADMAAIRLFIGDREYVGRAPVRVFDPTRLTAAYPSRRRCAPPQDEVVTGRSRKTSR
jgi:hypothetical protein